MSEQDFAELDSSGRLRAAMMAGTDAAPEMLDVLIERCAVEPDFFVRDMLTWALTRLPADLVVPRLVGELTEPGRPEQAVSQALHTLSKICDQQAWPAVRDVLTAGWEVDSEVARTAWRAAVRLVPVADRDWLAAHLVGQLGRGSEETRRSLSRALVVIEDAAEPLMQQLAASGGDSAVDEPSGDDPARLHAEQTLRMIDDPDGAWGSRHADR